MQANDTTVTANEAIQPLRATCEYPPDVPSWWQRVLLALIVLLATFLNFYRLNWIGYGNYYYAAGVKSMLLSWHNFFFVSLDPGGFVTIDKPPLGFWLQVLSVRMFGFSGVSLLLPEALAGVISVLLLHHLVARTFGQWAGLLAALALTLTPLSIVTSRNNTIDMLLVCCTLFAAWTLLKATETGHLRWLLVCALLVGLGFNIKMLQAYLVLPAFAITYLVGAPRRWWTRLLHLLLAGVLLLTVSLSWVAVVDMTPATQRPYVGSTSDNSELSLSMGWNGLTRLLGRMPASNVKPSTATKKPITETPAQLAHAREAEAIAQAASDIGAPDPLRLFNRQLGVQVSWLLPLASLAMIVLAWQGRIQFTQERRHQSLLLWGIWLLTMYAFFCVAVFFHVYYMVMLVPAICALAGIGIVLMWQDYVRPGWRGWLLPCALMLTSALQGWFIQYYRGWNAWLVPTIIGLCFAAALFLAIARLLMRPVFDVQGMPRSGRLAPVNRFFILMPVITIAVLVLLVAPTVWSGYSVFVRPGVQGAAGPMVHVSATGDVTIATPGVQKEPPVLLDAAYTRLIAYLQAHRQHARFLVVTQTSGPADPIILATGQPVMDIGGFGGGDKIVTKAQLIGLVNQGAIRFFLFSNIHRITHRVGAHKVTTIIVLGAGDNVDAIRWVGTHCSLISNKLWTLPNPHNSLNQFSLYNCSNHT
ncbi:glycosyltransferase family 39 protein [Dictyobacter formicarum]|uniref:Dolichyl-phosphate-mannose--protein mannosyltransferase n=1 Tax=Dictyobacter formicarum TaxID=2778368 RepID=A0ABQ3VGY6_9CHLR|nr:glycosyltransferase family 39 protein [Dictyobacter formicarum]GHO85300.1 dolichyl-phosphate-mannose--protein mannosyltransferase [Dictyobacter formicarum]